MGNKINSWVFICVFISMTGVLALGSSGSFSASISCPDPAEFPLNGCSLSGTTDGRFPYFNQQVSVSYKDKHTEDDSFKIKAKSLHGSSEGSLQLDDATTIDISKMKIKFNAAVEGAVASGSLRIAGNLPDPEKFKVSADLQGAWNASEDGMLWGFNLTNVSCSGAIDVNCSTDGVIYLNLVNAIGPATGEKKIKTSGIALTSFTDQVVIPVPATVWLFLSGLLGLVAVSRYGSTPSRG